MKKAATMDDLRCSRESSLTDYDVDRPSILGDDEEQKKDVVSSVLDWFYANCEEEFESFAAEFCEIFTDDEEQKHEYHDVYILFQERFEARLEQKIIDLGYEPEEFYLEAKEQCEKADEKDESLDNSAFWLQVMLSAFDYDQFRGLMIEQRNARQPIDLTGVPVD